MNLIRPIKKVKRFFYPYATIGYTHCVFIDNYGQYISSALDNFTDMKICFNMVESGQVDLFDIAIFTEKDKDLYDKLIEKLKT
jgi:hypothetical protein